MKMKMKMKSFLDTSRECFDNSPVAFIIMEAQKNTDNELIDFIFRYANTAYANLTGTKIVKFLNAEYNQLFPYDAADLVDVYKDVALNGNIRTFAGMISGKYCYIQCYQPSPQCCACIFTDISGEMETRKRLEHSVEQINCLINSLSCGIAIYKISDIMETLYFNDGVCALSGYTRDEYLNWIGNDGLTAVVEEDRPLLLAMISKSINDGSVVDISYRIYHKSGDKIWIHLTGTKMKEEEGFPVYHAVFMDISAEIQNQEVLKKRAERDDLTGLYNRAGMENILGAFFLDKKQAQAAFVMFDIDNFKKINDYYGHNIGDEVLIRFSKVLSQACSAEKTVARLGGDEFVIFAPQFTSIVAIKECIKKICESISMEYEFEQQKFLLSCSAGVALAPRDGNNFHLLYTNADKALLAAKNSGKNQVKIYSEDMQLPAPLIIQNMEWLLDEGSDAVYICNADTYELLYMNKVAVRLSDSESESYAGKMCYDYLMHQKTPCVFCKMKVMNDREFFEREFNIPNTEKHYILKGKLINWNGVNAHVEYIIDNSQRAISSREIKKQLNKEETLIKCIRYLTCTEDLNISLNNVLKTICGFYDAESCFIITKAKDADIAKKSHIYTQNHNGAQTVDVFNLKKCRLLQKSFADNANVLIIDIEEIKEAYKYEYELFRDNEIFNFRASCIDILDDFKGCLIVTNAKKNIEDIEFIQNAAYFVKNEMQKNM